MKCLFFLILYFFAFSALIFAQTNKSEKALKYGVSATMEKRKDVFLDAFHRDSDIGFSRIRFPVLYKSIKIEPELGYHGYDSKEKSSYDLWQYGIGLYYYVGYQDVNFYAGPRLCFEELASTFSTDEEMKQSYFNYGLTVGSEYFISERFAFGGDVQINKYIITNKTLSNFKIHHFSLIPSLYLSFYFQ